MRKGQKQVLTATVRSLEEATTALLSAMKERLGVAVRPVTAQEEERYGLESQQGVAITWLEHKGTLERAGLEVRDILLAIDDQPVESVERLSELAAALRPEQQITILALDHRSGNTGSVQVVLR
jgi:S1-C subfamily serine protease